VHDLLVMLAGTLFVAAALGLVAFIGRLERMV
jgi:hypothetical protein